ncbi:phosphopantothenoylcysteine synthase [Corynebacterium diphtheriae]|nr:flavoprotein [Corynebacterium diphtheriae]CAB0530652.1 phosphopantothenoylcysteine synthase [Corynebacterium diphtheriae]CAB0571414.1 phosphopantothenoylcysteine synthase [Corynebacterium diphtheriae]CAB0573190.1 phosphopantothenoylcysteine synthase [Corynebacterium diphtheriae]CAB0619562.1 phosphopantothenoylcysteine synthase [Corynebacterium diphtheriae]CAB0624192.1 phosphopantothenoylcysteine synthase [Corynebacterium diphtheriae]
MRRLAWLITGSMSAASIPGVLHSFRTGGISIEVEPFLTKSASSIVTPTAVSALSGVSVQYDLWDFDKESSPKHVLIENRYDAFVVAPATLNFLTKFISCDCSTPLSLALQCTKKPILLAPSLPPGGSSSVAYRRVESETEEWSNVSLLPPVDTTSVSNPKLSSAGFGSSARLIDFVLRSLES